MLEDLWPYIDADPDLGRDTLMLRPLEAMEYKGRLSEAPIEVLPSGMESSAAQKSS